MRLFIGILVGILVLFQYDLWFGKNGYFDYKDVAAQIKENKAENEKLSQRNQMISAEIQGLTYVYALYLTHYFCLVREME